MAVKAEELEVGQIVEFRLGMYGDSTSDNAPRRHLRIQRIDNTSTTPRFRDHTGRLLVWGIRVTRDGQADLRFKNPVALWADRVSAIVHQPEEVPQ